MKMELKLVLLSSRLVPKVLQVDIPCISIEAHKSILLPKQRLRQEKRQSNRKPRTGLPKGQASRSARTLTSSPALNPNSSTRSKKPTRRFVRRIGERGTQTMDASGSDTSSKYLPAYPT